MGISASQARLLTITARLTSNEYESQQISNAKMRLATQSEQASSDYISALNTTQLLFTTYDASGSAVNENLTANVLYQYADMKNQYAITNASGQIMVSSQDAYNFEKAENLDEFLGLYGITKEYKTESLQANMEALAGDEYQGYYQDWLTAIDNVRQQEFDSGQTDATGQPIMISSDEAYQISKYNAKIAYDNAIAYYDDIQIKFEAGVVTENVVKQAQAALAEAKADYAATITYDDWLQSQAAYEMVETSPGSGMYEKQETEVYKNVQQYFALLEEVVAEAEDLGTTMDDLFVYSDESKARWYTNLWYRMNGESSDKSAQGANGTNYTILDSKLASSSQWIQDSLTQGIISLEVAAYEEATDLIPDQNNPSSVILKGISWNSTIYSSCPDFTQSDNEAAIAKAEAEYEKKNNEINAKDQKYENKIKTLDTEHTALQTEYESVQSAMNKNIERSFKAFS